MIDDSSDASPELFAIKEEELLSSSSGLVMPALGLPFWLVDEGSFLNDLKNAVVDEVGGDEDVGDVASSPLPPQLLLLLCCCRRNN